MPFDNVYARGQRQPSFRFFEVLESRSLLTTVTGACPDISINGNTVIAVATSADDVVELRLDDTTHVLNISGMEFTFDANVVDTIRIGGGAGQNTVRILGTNLDDRGSAIGSNGTFFSNFYSVFTFSFQTTTLDGGGGNDYAQLYGSDVDDRYAGLPQDSTLTTPDNLLNADNFERVDAFGRGGNDYGTIYGTQEDDLYFARDAYALLTRPGNINYTNGFERIDAFGRGGNDRAQVFDSPGDDDFVSQPTFAYLIGGPRISYTRGFERVDAFSTLGGFDEAFFFDDATTDDTFTARRDFAFMSNGAYLNYANNFDRHRAVSAGGNDTAQLLDAWTEDTFQTTGNSTQLLGPARNDEATAFDNVVMAAAEGQNPGGLGLSNHPAANEFLMLLQQGGVDAATLNLLVQRLEATRSVQSGTPNPDELLGTLADEEFDAGNANDIVYADGGSDLVRGGAGNDGLYGMAGADFIFGGAGNDELLGGDGDDFLVGGDGDDIVDGEFGTDYVAGGAGNDLFRFVPVDDTVVIADFSVLEDRIELINTDPVDLVLGQDLGSLSINHPAGLNIVLIGVPLNTSMNDLPITFVTSESQTRFQP